MGLRSRCIAVLIALLSMTSTASANYNVLGCWLGQTRNWCSTVEVKRTTYGVNEVIDLGSLRLLRSGPVSTCG